MIFENGAIKMAVQGAARRHFDSLKSALRRLNQNAINPEEYCVYKRILWNRNIKNIFIKLQISTNIMANEVKTPIQN